MKKKHVDYTSFERDLDFLEDIRYTFEAISLRSVEALEILNFAGNLNRTEAMDYFSEIVYHSVKSSHAINREFHMLREEVIQKEKYYASLIADHQEEMKDEVKQE